MTLLARLIAREEGFNVPGSLPARHHNPGDLRHSPHSSHVGEDPNGIGEIADDATGWADLERQLQRYATRDMTLAQLAYTYAPPEENNTAAYLRMLCAGLGMTADALVADALKLP